MTIDKFIEKILSLDPHKIQRFFEKDYDGGCPCFSGKKTIDGKKIFVRGRCWRVSKNAQDLHIWGEMDKKDLCKIAKAIKKQLDDQKWYNPYTIIYDKEPFV